MTSKTQTRANGDPDGGTTGSGPGPGTSTLEGAGGHGSESCVTFIFGDHRNGSACTVSRAWAQRAGPGMKSRSSVLIKML